MYLATHEGEPPTGDFHPHTHAHAGRTQPIAPYCRPLAVRNECEQFRFGRQTVSGIVLRLYVTREALALLSE